MTDTTLSPEEEWVKIDQAKYERVMGVVGDTISPIGIGLAVLSICSLIREAFVRRNPFYVIMFMVACLDACFCSLYLVYSVCYRPIKAGGCTSRVVAWILLIVRGTVYSVSLASDMCILALTFERYMAICWPQRYKTLSVRVKRWAYAVGAAVVLLVSATRYHYSIELVVVEQSADCYSYELSPALPALVGMTMFNEMILPFVLAVCLLFFTAKITLVVLRRRRQRVDVRSTTDVVWLRSGDTQAENRAGFGQPSAFGPSASVHSSSVAILDNQQQQRRTVMMQDQRPMQNNNNNNNNNSGNSIVSLTLCLDTLFTMNQLGYCIYAVGSWSEAYCQDRYDGPFCSFKLLRSRISFASILLECLARSLSFALYLIFSRTLRAEFVFVCSTVWKYTVVRPSETISAVFDQAEHSTKLKQFPRTTA